MGKCEKSCCGDFIKESFFSVSACESEIELELKKPAK